MRSAGPRSSVASAARARVMPIGSPSAADRTPAWLGPHRQRRFLGEAAEGAHGFGEHLAPVVVGPRSPQGRVLRAAGSAAGQAVVPLAGWAVMPLAGAAGPPIASALRATSSTRTRSGAAAACSNRAAMSAAGSVSASSTMISTGRLHPAAAGTI